jgi:SAM-dependent methyltransferase
MDAVSAHPRPWNHNTQYHPVVLGAIPAGCRRSLRQVVPHVTGVDRDAASIDLARRHDEGAGIEYVLGDFMTHPFEPASFDHIASIAALHHMDAAPALDRMRALLAPGGTLAIVGLARNRYPADLPFAIAGAVGHRVHRLSKPWWADSAPRVWPPPDTYAQTRRLAQRLLPGVRYRRLLLFRYSLVWTKPA